MSAWPGYKWVGSYNSQLQYNTYYTLYTYEAQSWWRAIIIMRLLELGILPIHNTHTRAVKKKTSFFNTAYFFPPETDFEYVP